MFYPLLRLLMVPVMLIYSFKFMLVVLRLLIQNVSLDQNLRLLIENILYQFMLIFQVLVYQMQLKLGGKELVLVQLHVIQEH